jgi:hypothetical protein
MAYPINIHHHQFLESSVAYQAAESFWEQALRDLLAESDLTWQPFYQNPGQDGNPLFSAWVPDRSKLIRIIQFTPEEDDEQLFSAWIDTWEGDLPEGLVSQQNAIASPIPELVIDLALTDVTRQMALTYIYLWLVMDVSPESMQRILEVVG